MMLALPIRGPLPPEYRAALADEWAAAAWHEAGHAVAQAAAGLPLHRSRIAYKGRRTWRAEHWCVTARTDLTQAGGLFRKTTRDDLVAVMAGAEAEALWLYDNKGMTTADARRTARDAADDDNRQALRFAGGSKLAVIEAADEAALQVRLRRAAIAEVARLLQANGTVTGAQVRAAVAATVPVSDGDLGDWLGAIHAVAESDQHAGVTTDTVLDAGQAAVDKLNALRGRS